MKRIDTRQRRLMHKVLSFASLIPGRFYQSLISEKMLHSEIRTGIVFIVGAPRTGTTLLYQILTNFLNVSYLSNLSNVFYHSLLSGMILHDRVFGSGPHNNFTSDNGRTRRWIDVNESGKFWYQWYPKDVNYLSDEDIKQIDFSPMINIVNNIQLRLKKPLVFKNQTNSQRIRSLAQFFPDSLFIHVIRNPLFVAKSILLHRRRFFRSPLNWYSIKPENYEEIKKLDCIEQVVRQIHAIDCMISRDLNMLSEDRRLTVSYEQICTNWRDITLRAKNMLSRYGRIQDRRGVIHPKIIFRDTELIQKQDSEIKAIAEKIRQVYV